MKKRFTAIASNKVLRELGWGNPATWAEVFDFLSEKGMLVSISRSYDFGEECFTEGYDWWVDCEETLRMGEVGYARTWERAAKEAVMKCLEQLKVNL